MLDIGFSPTSLERNLVHLAKNARGRYTQIDLIDKGLFTVGGCVEPKVRRLWSRPTSPVFRIGHKNIEQEQQSTKSGYMEI